MITLQRSLDPVVRAVVFGVLAMLCAGFSGGAQIIPKEDGSFSKVPSGRVGLPSEHLGKEVIALAFVDPNRLAVAREALLPRLGVLGTTLSFYRRKGGALVETHRFTTQFPLAQMYPNLDGDRLVTTWAIGMTYRTGIFAWGKKGDPRPVLWEEWQQVEPELLDGTNRVIFAVNATRDNPPDKAMIYQWTGTEYKIPSLVPWSERHQQK